MTLISAKGLSVDLGGRRVLTQVDLSVKPGEIVTLLGPNGSGKSTLLRSLIGAIKPVEGRIERAPGLRLGYVPQRLQLDPTLPICVGRFLHLTPARTRTDAATILDSVGLPDLSSRPLGELSGGQFQRVLLARALLSNPQLLLLDEPTQGLDQPGTASFYRLIAELREKLGIAILMVSHDLHVVMSASDRVICVNGHICCEGTPSVVSEAPEYRALFGLGTQGMMALYQHGHDHHHGHDTGEEHIHQ